jgi:hypothetical protein
MDYSLNTFHFEQPPPPTWSERARWTLFAVAGFGIKVITTSSNLWLRAPDTLLIATIVSFAYLCFDPRLPNTVVLLGAALWWFLVLRRGRRIIRILIAIVLFAAIGRALFAPTWFPNQVSTRGN